MADLANLRISVDSRDVNAASQSLNSMGSAAANAAGNVGNVGAVASRTSAAVSSMNAVIQQGAAAQTAAANAMRAVGQTGQLASHQITNLAFQFQDLGVQIASGANPLTAFVQQGSQISGIMMQSGMSAKQFGVALLSTIGLLKTTTNAELDAAAASTAASAARFRALNAQATEAIIAAQAELALAAAQAEGAVTATAAQAATDRRTAAQTRLAAAQVEAAATARVLAAAETQAAGAAAAAGAATSVAFAPVAIVLAAVAAAAGVLFVAFKQFQSAVEDDGVLQRHAASLGLTQKEMKKLGDVSITAGDVMRGLWKTMYDGLGLERVFSSIASWAKKAWNVLLEGGAMAAAGVMAAFRTAYDVITGKTSILDIGGAFLKNYAESRSDLKALGETIGDNIIGSAKDRISAEAKKIIADRNPTKGKEDKSAENAIKEAERFLEQLRQETKQVGMNSIEIKRNAVEMAAAKVKGTELANAILEAGKAWEKATSDKANADFQKNIIKPLEDELGLLELTGTEREVKALELQKEGKMAEWSAQGMTDLNAKWEEYYQLQMGGIQIKSRLERDRKEAEKLKQALNSLSGMMDDLFGGAGSFLQNLGREIRIAAPDLEKNLKAMFDEFPEKTKEAFQGFLDALPGVLANAKIGSMVGGGVGGAVGGAIGGALGKEFLTKGLQDIGGKVFGKALGSFAGPLGAIAGGLLGGLIGGLFTKTKTGTATLTQIAGGAMQKTLAGNSAQLKGVADKMANGLLTALGNVAEQLGGTLGGAVNISVGMRKKDYVVDPTGQGRTKGAGVMNFGQDQAAAAAYAMQQAINQGIITGISAGAQTLIRAGGDLNTQVQKALKFDQVFKDLKKETDPLGASLDELSAEMAKAKAIFDEAGASAADYAKLEELYAIKQAKAVFEAGKARRELEIQLMEAQGDASGALAAKRQLELESMDAGLRALQQQVWAAEDAAKAAQELADANAKAAEEAKAAAEAVKALADDRRSLEIDLMEALGNSAGALAARRQAELDAMDESLRALQQQIWAALDARAAAEAAANAAKALAEEQAKAAEAAAKLAADRRELEIQLLEAQGFALDALNARRAIELEATDASLRSLKEAIWAAQAKAEADAAAAKAAEDAAAAEAKAAQDAADAMQKYMETLADVSQTVTEEINRLRGINASSTSVLLKAQFATLTAQARTGNLDALAKLPELSRSIEEATIGTAGSALEVARIRAWLSASLGETLAAQAASNAQVNTAGAGLVFDGNQTTTATTAQTADAISNMRGDLYNALYQIAKNTGKSYELMDRWDGDGLPDIREDASDYY